MVRNLATTLPPVEHRLPWWPRIHHCAGTGLLEGTAEAKNMLDPGRMRERMRAPTSYLGELRLGRNL